MGETPFGRSMRVLFLIRSWNRGGAERQCATLVREFAKRSHEVVAVSIYPGGVFAEWAGATGARILHAGRERRRDIARPVWRLMRIIRQIKPEVVYSFMPLANLLSLLARFASPTSAIVWGIRTVALPSNLMSSASRFSYFLERTCLNRPDAVICNATAIARELESIRSSGLFVVENGIDPEVYRSSYELRQTSRRELSLSSSDVVIGIVGSLVPRKDHCTFLRAARRVLAREPQAWFLIAGDGEATYVETLRGLARQLGIESRIIWMPSVADVRKIYCALDLLVSSSITEGFANVIGEAMACEVPVVATDVGDSRRIVGDPRFLVRPSQPEELAIAINAALALNPRLLGRMAREQIMRLYGVENCVMRTEAALRSAIENRDLRTAAQRAT